MCVHVLLVCSFAEALAFLVMVSNAAMSTSAQVSL